MSLHPTAIDPVPDQTAAVARAAFPHGNRYLTMRDTLGTLFTDQDFVHLFSSRGQPAYPPWRLALVTVLPFAEGVSDHQAAEAVRARLDWMYALGLELTDPGFDFSLLSEFRARLRAAQAEDRLFATLVVALQDRGFLKARGQQRTDSTHVLAAIHTLNRLACIGETMRAALNDIAGAAPIWLREQLDPQWAERYQERVQAYRLPTSKADRVRHAEAIGADGVPLLAAISAPAVPPALRTQPARWRDHGELPPAAVLIHSPHDTETHFGIKRETTWTGSKVHRTERCDPDQPALITNAETTAATLTDNGVVGDIHDQLATRNLLPRHHIVDAGYTDARGMVAAATDPAVELVGPVLADTNWQARQNRGYAAADFALDWANHAARCPQGRTSSSWRAHHDHTGHDVVDVRWSWTICKACPVLDACSQKQRGSRTRKLRAEVEQRALQASRHRHTTPAFRGFRRVVR
jgi:transposase